MFLMILVCMPHAVFLIMLCDCSFFSLLNGQLVEQYSLVTLDFELSTGSFGSSVHFSLPCHFKELVSVSVVHQQQRWTKIYLNISSNIYF